MAVSEDVPGSRSNEAKVLAVQKLQADRTLSIDQICGTLRISRSTYYRYLQLKRAPPVPANGE